MPVTISRSKPQTKSKKRVFYHRVANKKSTLKSTRPRATKSLFKSTQGLTAISHSQTPKSTPPPKTISEPDDEIFDDSHDFPLKSEKTPLSFSFNLTPNAQPEQENIKPEEDYDDSLDDLDFSPSLEPDKPISSTVAESEISQLKHLIEQTSQKIFDLEQEKSVKINAPSTAITDPQEFNGVSSPDESAQLLQAQIDKFNRENKKLKHQLEQIKKEFDTEKKQLEKTIKDLKSELHRSTPLQDNKFFSLSKELHQAVSAIEKLADSDSSDDNLPTPHTPPVTPPEQTPPPQPTPVVTTSNTKTIQVGEERKKKSLSKPPKIAIIAITGITLIGLGGVATHQLTKNPQVDQKLVDSYISETGAVKGAQEGRELINQGDKQLELPYDQTKWEWFSDSIMNVRVSYPQELVERLQTSNSVTFLRKNGFLFKIQRNDSTLSLSEFWDKQKDSGLSYEVNEFKFKSKDAYHLRLLDEAEYPGDRYLIKHGDQIFDIWYATESDKFSQDDIKRAQHMLDSFSWLD